MVKYVFLTGKNQMSQQAEFATPEEHIAELYRCIDVLHDRLNSIEPILLLFYQAAESKDLITALAQRAYQLAQENNTNPNAVYFLKSFVEITAQTRQENVPLPT